MEEEKKGSGGPPTEQLTREQVMAQRAEKKRLKEARKNKGNAPAAGGDAGGGDSNVPATKPPQKESKPKGQKQQQTGKQKPGNEEAKQTDKGQQQKRKPPPQQVKQSSTSKPTGPSEAASPKSATPTKKAAETPKLASEAPVVASNTLLPKSASNASVPEESKPDKASGKSTDYQSTIRSLFKVQRKDSPKDKHFNPHPLFYNLGVKLKNNVIRGTNLRCVKLLQTLKDFIILYKTPSGSAFKHALTAELDANLEALRKKCPFAIGMTNAVEFLLSYLYKIDDVNKDTHRLKEELIEVIDQYIDEKIEKAVEAIVYYGKDIIHPGDVIMVYSITEAVLQLLQAFAKKEIAFELIIIQTPETMLDIPLLLEKISGSFEEGNIIISSVNFSNAIYRIRHCTKILIGGHGLFTTGGVMAKSGSGKLALLANTYNKPAIFLCETFKFCDRSPLDSFALDEYMPEQSTLEDCLFEPKIKYDVTPANLVTVVVTDIDLLPSTSVPVVLRVQENRVARKEDEHSSI